MKSVTEWFRSWRLVSWRSAVVAAAVLYTLIGFFMVPWIVKSQIEKQSLKILKRQATVEKVRCNPFTLSLTIEGFSLPDRPESVLLGWDRLYANAQLSSLFRWAATLKELRIENPHVALRRFEDGTVNVLELMEDVDTGKLRSEEGGLPRALLQHAVVVNGSIDVEDRHRPEPVLWELGPSQVELVGISTIPEREGTNDVVIGLPSGATIKANGTVVVEPLGLKGALELKGLHLPNAWRGVDYLFEFEMTSGILDVNLKYEVGLEDDGLHLIVDGADVRIADLDIRWEDREVDLLTVDAIAVSGGHLEWPEQVIAAETVVVEGAEAFAWLEPDGTPAWELVLSEELRKKVAAVLLSETINIPIRIGRCELRDAAAELEDRSISPPIRFVARDVNFAVTDIATETGTPWPFEASASLAEAARGTASGSIRLWPVKLEAEVALDNLDLAKYQPYVAELAPLELRAGVLKATGTARASLTQGANPLQVSFQGGFDVTGLDLNETITGDKLLGWGDLKVAGIDARLEPRSADVREAAINNAGLEITVAEDGTINLLEFFKALAGGEETTAGDAVAAAGSALPPVHIARMRLNDCYGIYTDKTVSGPFRMALTPIDGTISAIATDSSAAAVLDIDAEISSGGLVRVEGAIDPFDYRRLTDLRIDVRDMLLPAVSPMSVKFIGHPITDGDVTLDLDYDIADRYLKATYHIEADDLVLGDKVEGEGLINLPFKLGVSLLKDKEGRITLDVPFEGSFDTPGFGMATAAGAAVKEIMSELVKSPFKLLGRTGGGGDQDLEFVEFTAGSATLDERTKQNLSTLSAALGERPTLALVVHGSYDAEADGLGLREAAFREAVLARGVSAEDFAIIIPLEILESMYAELLTAEGLAALRVTHTAAQAEGREAVVDEVAYRLAVREALVTSQPLADGAVTALASARAEAIRSFMVDQAGLDSARVSIAPEPQVQAGSEQWVRCQLELAAE
jgi:hypothetical protein